jgi:hypothetical protein
MPFAFDPQRRLRYFTGQFLQEEDFLQQQAYHVDRQRHHSAQLHTPGIAAGLGVTGVEGEAQVTVQEGTAVDRDGTQIVLAKNQTVPWDPAANATQTLLLVLSVKDVEDTPATVGDNQATRVFEQPVIQVLRVGDVSSDSPLIRLARLKTDAAGKLTGAIDTTVRVKAGAVVGDDLAVTRLTIRNAAATATWPVLSSSAANQTDLTGGLTVGGQLSANNLGAKLVTKAALNLIPVNSGVTDVGPGSNITVAVQSGVSLKLGVIYFAFVVSLAPGGATSAAAALGPVKAEIVYTHPASTPDVDKGDVSIRLDNQGPSAKVGWQVFALTA